MSYSDFQQAETAIQPNHGTESVTTSIPEIVVTPAMIKAGLDELREHSYAGDQGYMLESVYRAMVYEMLAASAISSPK